MGANGAIEGRMLSTAGAVGFYTATAFKDKNFCGVPSQQQSRASEIGSISTSKNGIDIDAGTDADADIDDVILYPNPTHDNIHIDMRGYVGKAGTIEVYNNLGQKMTARNYLSFPTIPAEFDVSGFTNGMYLISIKVENHRRFTKKFIVNKL
jgi:hypothetical protein